MEGHSCMPVYHIEMLRLRLKLNMYVQNVNDLLARQNVPHIEHVRI